MASSSFGCLEVVVAIGLHAFFGISVLVVPHEAEVKKGKDADWNG